MSRLRAMRVLLLVALTTSLCTTPALAATVATPEVSVSARLVWTTMIAIDNANRTGNYSVLRALGSRDFQRTNSEVQLAQVFRKLRDDRVDLGRAVLMEPTFYLPPTVDSSGHLRLRGGFESRPLALRFDLIFLYEDGGWSLLAVSVIETSASAPR